MDTKAQDINKKNSFEIIPTHVIPFTIDEKTNLEWITQLKQEKIKILE